MKPIWKHPDDWAKVSAQAVADGSRAQAANVLEMALQDIAALAERLAELDPGAKVELPYLVRDLSAPLRFRKPQK
jgi:hypothetical protein